MAIWNKKNDPTTATPAPALTSKCHAERCRARDAKKASAEAAHEAELQRLGRERDAANRRLETEMAEADRIHDETTAALDAARAEALPAELDPLVAAFGETPRAAAGKIAEVWRRHHEALLEETGEALSPLHLGFAFARAHGLPKLGPQFWTAAYDSLPGAVASRVAQAILGGGYAVEVEAKLRELEIAVLSHARLSPQVDADGFTAMSGRAGERRVAVEMANHRAGAHG